MILEKYQCICAKCGAVYYELDTLFCAVCLQEWDEEYLEKKSRKRDCKKGELD